MSKWTDFVKDWAAKNNTTYGCALSNPKCSADYRKENPTKKQQKEAEAKAEEDKRKQMIADEEVRRKAKKEAKAEAERLLEEEKKRLAEEEKRLADEAKKMEEEKRKMEVEAKKKQDEKKTKETVKREEIKLRKNILGLPTELKENILGFVDRSISKEDLEKLIEIHKDLDYQYAKIGMINNVEMSIPKYAQKDATDFNNDVGEVMRLIDQIFELSGKQDMRDEAEKNEEWYFDYGELTWDDESDVGILGEKFDSAKFKNYIKKAKGWVREWRREVKMIGKNILPEELSKETIKAREKAKAEKEKKVKEAKPSKPFEISSTKIGGASGWKKDYTDEEIRLIEASAERAVIPSRGNVGGRKNETLPFQADVDEAIAKKYGLTKSWTNKAKKLLVDLKEKKEYIHSGIAWADIAKKLVRGEYEGKGIGSLNNDSSLNDAIETAINMGLYPSYEEAKSAFNKSVIMDIPFSKIRKMDNFNPKRLKSTAEKAYPIRDRPRGEEDISSVKYIQSQIKNGSQIEPIWILKKGSSYILLDGAHRIVASHIEKAPFVRAEVVGSGLIYGGAGEAEMIQQKYNLSKEQWKKIRQSTMPSIYPNIVLTPEEYNIRKDYENLKKIRNPNTEETRAKAIETFYSSLGEKGFNSRSEYEKKNREALKNRKNFNFDLGVNIIPKEDNPQFTDVDLGIMEDVEDNPQFTDVDLGTMEGKGMRKLKLLELFKGTGSVGKAAKKQNMEVKSLDFLEKYKPDILADMLTWDYKKWWEENKWTPDLIWASPPCNTFSPLAYVFKERNTKTAVPYSKRAKEGTQILYRTLEAIKFFQSKNPKILFIIENPRGMMRLDKKMKNLPRETTTYCAYGDFKRKPTDFWNNLPNGLDLKPVAECPNPEKVISVQDIRRLDDRYSIPQRLMTKLLTEMRTQYGDKPKDVIGGMIKMIKDDNKIDGKGINSDTCFTEKEVQDLLKNIAEWVKEEPVEPTRAEIVAKARAEITKKKSSKRGLDKAKKSTKPYAYEREAHQQALKEAYPRGKGLKKGSQEAKAWGEKMRAMRGKPKETKSTKSCCKMCAGKGCYCCE